MIAIREMCGNATFFVFPRQIRIFFLFWNSPDSYHWTFLNLFVLDKKKISMFRAHKCIIHWKDMSKKCVQGLYLSIMTWKFFKIYFIYGSNEPKNVKLLLHYFPKKFPWTTIKSKFYLNRNPLRNVEEYHFSLSTKWRKTT